MNVNNTGFSRRALLSAFVVTPSLTAVLAACGDTTKGAGANRPTPTIPPTAPATTAPATTIPATTIPASTATTTVVATAPVDSTTAVVAIAHPTGADDVVLRLGYVGGFVRTGYAFTSVPTTLICGDGRLFSPGVTTAIFPGPLLSALSVRTITEGGIQTILAAAEKAGLLAVPPDYHADVAVADVPDTQLELDAKGGTFVHQANALGYADPAESKSRKTLSDFCDSLGDMEALVGAHNLGANTPFVPTSFRFQATPLTVEDLAGYTDPKPTEVPWPSGLGVALADASTCARISAATLGNLFADADQLTFFTDGGTTFMVAAVGELPGDTCGS